MSLRGWVCNVEAAHQPGVTPSAQVLGNTQPAGSVGSPGICMHTIGGPDMWGDVDSLTRIPQ